MKKFILRPEVEDALLDGKPLVALESALVTHGLPMPQSLETAKRAEEIIRAEGAIPATIAVLDGKICIGLSASELEDLVNTDNPWKFTSDNLATGLAKRASGGTTVAATMLCAQRAGIKVFATGGIGGVHRGWQGSLDISADLRELACRSVTVVCSGAKALLDLPSTLEYLETMGVPVIGLATETLPAFFSIDSGLALRQSASDIEEVAEIITHRRSLKLNGGEVIAVPPPSSFALPWSQIKEWVNKAISEARTAEIRNQFLTPFLLDRIAELSEGRTILVNIALIQNNAKVAGQLAVLLNQGRSYE